MLLSLLRASLMPEDIQGRLCPPAPISLVGELTLKVLEFHSKVRLISLQVHLALEATP
jgi:hypothetical protein